MICGHIKLILTTNVGSRSITIGADGLGIISAEDGLGDGMFFAHCNDILCSSATLMKLDAGRISKSSSITIGIDGLPLISYLDFDNGDLKVVHCADPLCIPYFRRR